jgi:hypothetical protein
MSQMNNIKVRLIHTIVEDGAELNISTATGKTIIVQKPDGTKTSFTATFYTDGTDAKIYYDTVAGDLNQAGLYKSQALLLMGGGTYYSSKGSFRIESNL